MSTPLSRINPEMAKLIATSLTEKFTQDTIANNMDAFAVYASLPSKQGGAADKITASRNPEELAKQLTAKLLIDHGAIRSFRHLGDDNIALSGIDPFVERLGAIGFIKRSPFDNYPFKDRGVAGMHMELQPDLVKKCGLNMGSDYDDRYFKWFLSEQSSSMFPDELQKELINALRKGKDPMNEQQLKLLEKVKNGENLSDKDAENLISGIYDFMTVPFAKIPDSLARDMKNLLEKSKAEGKKDIFKVVEYFYSGVFSKINHVAYVSENTESLFKAMQAAKISLTDLQGKEPLQQFGANALHIEDKWSEFIQRSVLKNAEGHLIDHDGKPSNREYIKRNFEFKNADALFPAGIPK